MKKRKTPTLFVAIGLPASGKSSFRTDACDVFVSSDKIRKELYGDEMIQGDRTEVFRATHALIEEYLESGYSVYADSTHVCKEWRKDVIEIAKDCGAAIVAVVFRTPFWKCVLRDWKRPRTVGLWVMLKMWFQFQEPTQEEGFEIIFNIRLERKIWKSY
jgi:predicted kinase